jgi:creatinine amidohydrolase
MKIAELTGKKASEVVGKMDTVVIPVGTLERHGPHCSVMSDVLIPEKIAQEIDGLMGEKVLIGPTIPYGHTWRLKSHAGSHDVPRQVLADYAFYVVKGFQQWGIKYAVLLNGHGGNIEALHDAAERASDLGIKTVVLSWWTGGFQAVMKEVVQDLGGHGGEAETSLLWNAGDQYVDSDAIPKQEHSYSFKAGASVSDVFDQDVNKKIYPQAYSGRPFAASKEKGRVLTQKAAKLVVETIDALRNGDIVET